MERGEALQPADGETLSSQLQSDDEERAKRGDDIIAWIREGQQARAEELAERLELAIDAILEDRLQGRDDDISARRETLFELYEREVLTRDQVRVRGTLDPSAFWDELHAYRLRNSDRQRGPRRPLRMPKGSSHMDSSTELTS